MGTGGGTCLPPAPLPAAAACCARNCAIKEPSFAKLMFIVCVSGKSLATPSQWHFSREIVLGNWRNRNRSKYVFLTNVFVVGRCLCVRTAKRGTAQGGRWSGGAGIMPRQKLTPLKTKTKAHNMSNLSSPVPLGSPDEQQAPDSKAPAVAKKKSKKITLRELPPEGAGLMADWPPRADLDSIYVPAKLGRRRESLGGMAGNWSPLARLSRVGSGPVACRCALAPHVPLTAPR